MTGGNDERENTLNQLLTEMDGFGTNTNYRTCCNKQSWCIGQGINESWWIWRQIYVDLPDVREKRDFAVHLKPIKTTKTLDTDFLAKQTPGFSGADIANVLMKQH